MFTGLIEAVGTVSAVAPAEKGLELVIRSPWCDLILGESIALDGACLTVTARDNESFRVHVVTSSLDRTCFAEYRTGRRVNLERAVQVGARLGGHLVQGHVDGIGIIERIAQREDARLVDLRVPLAVANVSIDLGSLTVDGVSLTINAKPETDVLQVSLIPFTLAHTTLGDRRVGDRVHLEADMIGKYVKQLLGVKREEGSG
jgi:riboflavin synthase